MGGSWAITSFKVLKKKPVFKAKGTELFNGCMDLQLHLLGKDRSDKVQLGTCAHPVVGGTGAFAGATGFLMMVDTPIKKKSFLKTHYEGVINVAGVLSARAAGPPRHC